MTDFVDRFDQTDCAIAIAATPGTLRPAPGLGRLDVGWASMRKMLVWVICAGTPR